jgi:alkylation response protein AidB-like acyl-CoA dehydrogenase
MTGALYKAAEKLEQTLGDANDSTNPFGFNAALQRDSAGTFPQAFREVVAEQGGLHLSFIPAAAGGTGTPFDETIMQVRVAARRDLAVMPAAMFSITATTCVLLTGSDEQVKCVVDLLTHGGAVGFALSEPEHGADVLGGECRLERAAHDLVLDGEKWMIGLGNRCDALYLVARTGQRGPAAFSGVLLETDDLAAANSAALECTGMRGIDFARLRFCRQPVREDQMVGGEGQGLAAALRALQIVRVMGTAANLACTDTALRTTVEYASRRRVANRFLLQHSRARRDLALAFAWHFATDVAAICAARAVHVCPQSLSHWSSVVKRWVTEATGEIFARCADILGTWSVVRQDHGAIFDKARRDAQVLRYVDTGPEATLRVLSAQLPSLLDPAAECDAARHRVDTVFDLHAPLPDYDPSKLGLYTRGTDDVVAAFEARHRDIGAHLPDSIASLVTQLSKELAAMRERVSARASDLVESAESFCALHTAASCVLLWSANRDRALFGGLQGATGWLEGALLVTLAAASGRRPRVTDEHADAILDLGCRMVDRNWLLSAVPVELAGNSSTAMEVTP